MRFHLAVLTVLAAAAPGWAAVAPVAVSPGDVSKVVQVEDRCPTFSWGSVSGARGYELVVYRVGDEAEPVLRQRIAGTALGWTPPLGRCLDRGGRYAWSVRALARKGASPWSAPALFEVAVVPSRVEVETALQVLRQYVGARGDAEGMPVAEARAEPESEPGNEAAASSPGPRAVGTTQLSVDGGVVATSFTGDGSTLTSLDASQLASGTVPGGVLSGTYSGGLSFPNVTSATVANATVSTSLVLSGAATLTGSTLTGGTFNSGTFNGSHAGDGSGLTDLQKQVLGGFADIATSDNPTYPFTFDISGLGTFTDTDVRVVASGFRKTGAGVPDAPLMIRWSVSGTTLTLNVWEAASGEEFSVTSGAWIGKRLELSYLVARFS